MSITQNEADKLRQLIRQQEELALKHEDVRNEYFAKKEELRLYIEELKEQK